MRTLPLAYHALLDQLCGISTPKLAQWIKQSLASGADPDEVAELLVASGQPLDGATALVQMGRNGLFLGAQMDERIVERSVMGTPQNVEHATHHWIDAGDRKVRKVMSLGSLDAVLYEDFLSDEECEHIKTVSKPYLTRSAVVGKNFSNVETRIRTSAGAFLDRAMDSVIDRVEKRIGVLTGTGVERGEGLQVLHYVDAQEYQPHYDFFEPQNEEEAKMMELPGNRIGTLIMYLSEVEEGGATYFPQLKLAIHPKKGSAIWFGYIAEDGVPDRRSEHAGLPIITGDKWIATKWVRERAFNQPAGISMDMRYSGPGEKGQGAQVLEFPGKNKGGDNGGM
jgi:prolyl 4-hydroxylase